MNEGLNLVDPVLHRALDNVGHSVGPLVSTVCPHCGVLGTLVPLGNNLDVTYQKQERNSKGGIGLAGYHFGIRRCPNPKCLAFTAVILRNGELLWIAPPQLIRFRSESVPGQVAESLKEAVACHSVGSFKAAAIMVRRAMELLCDDKKIVGDNLKARIAKLGQHVTLPPALLSAADHLRILGNDAAHVEAKVYSEIHKPHAEAAIELAKRILESVYQHDDLVAQLTKLAGVSVAEKSS